MIFQISHSNRISEMNSVKSHRSLKSSKFIFELKFIKTLVVPNCSFGSGSPLKILELNF